MAMRMGKHVYVEKPISHTIREGRAMVKAAREAGRVVQVGTHRRVSPHNVSGREFIRSGKLGKIALVEIYCYYHMRARENPPDTDPPENLDWEMWTGPAPMRPYKAKHRRWQP